eukprot:scaffold255781_cov17-Prasinocladus_malaysianus.AAC.1
MKEERTLAVPRTRTVVVVHHPRLARRSRYVATAHTHQVGWTAIATGPDFRRFRKQPLSHGKQKFACA